MASHHCWVGVSELGSVAIPLRAYKGHDVPERFHRENAAPFSRWCDRYAVHSATERLTLSQSQVEVEVGTFSCIDKAAFHLNRPREWVPLTKSQSAGFIVRMPP